MLTYNKIIMNIGIDLDNVLADFQTTWLAYHNKHYGTSIRESDITVYNYGPIIGITTEEVVKRVYEFYDSPEFDDIIPEKGAQEAIPALSENHTLYIITSRPDRTIPRTRDWVERYFPDHIEKILHTNQFSTNPDGMVTKSSICLEYDITLMVEDAPTYAEEIATAGITTLLLDQTWNRDLEEQEHDNIIRVKNWDRIVIEIEKMMKGQAILP
jgi:uncharacterized protein